MAIVETLEIRFAAKLGNLGAQLAAVTAALSGLGGVSAAVMGGMTAASFGVRSALDGVNLSTQVAQKAQGKLSSKLKKTGSAFKGVSNAAKQAAKGIGLHKLDEVNLTASPEKNKTSSGGGSGGSASAAGMDNALDGLEKLGRMLEKMPGFFERFYINVRRSMKGVDGWLNKATGGLAGKLLGLLGTAGKNAAESLVDRLLGSLNLSRSDLASKGQSLLQAVAEAMRSGANSATGPAQAGSTLAGKLSGGILSGQTSAKSAASAVTLAAKFGGESAKTAAGSAGLDLSKGFANGMLSYIDKIKSAAASLASAALNKLKNLLKISSPSKVTFAMGGFFSEGFAGGIASSVNLAQHSASMLARGAAMSLNPGMMSFGGDSDMSAMVRTAVNDALGSADIVIPINVDGMKLGEAAIRGINRVTRASGRLMLDI